MRLMAAMLILAAAAGAQWRRLPSDPYHRGSSRNAGIDRVLDDLDRAASRAWLDHHERKHFDDARRNLLRFQSNWSRGDFDRGRLDGAIDSMNHLIHADRVHPRDRQILDRDVDLLRELRASRGDWYRRWPR